ncbi:MAG: phosphoribosylanthranilate isomerase [Thermodesulfobacteriota bacterium]
MAGRTRVKICGMTEPFEVRKAVEAGVDALGFIFVKESPRAIDPEVAKEIIAELPPFVDAVGVFMNQDPEVVSELVHYCGLTVIQLHGQEPPEYCEVMPGRVIKAFQVKPDMASEFLEPYNDVVRAFLLDTYHKEMAGGTGETFDWSLVEKLKPRKPLILAGGLNVDNVGAAIKQIQPFAVDVNSGIEISPGRKDPEKIKELFKEVSQADNLCV